MSIVSMKEFSSTRGLWFALCALRCVLADFGMPASAQQLSNLDNRWPDSSGIGDCHTVQWTAPIIARFSTGEGTYTLDSVTLEFLVLPPLTAPWGTGQVQLHQLSGDGSVLLGYLGSPQLNPRPTQWPSSVDPVHYTAYIDFHPASSLVLQPYSQYSVVVNDSDSWHDAALLFTRSAAYTSTRDWRMDPTSTSNPFADGEFLKLAVSGTLVPEPSAMGVASCGVMLFALGAMCRRPKQGVKPGQAGPNQTRQATPDRRPVEVQRPWSGVPALFRSALMP